MAQKTITVGTAGTPADLDTNFQNTQDNFTELYSKNGTQDTAIAANTAKRTYPSADETKLASIEDGATVDQTGAEIKVAYEGELNTNAFTDAEKTKLAGIADGATVNTDLTPASQLEMESGTEVALRSMSPLRVAQAIAAQAGAGGTDDQTATEVPFTPYGTIASTNVQAAIQEVLDEASGSAHSAVTLGTANGLSLAGQELSLSVASAVASGALSSADWNTFNGKSDFDGAYSSLTGQPTIPVALSDLTEDTTHRVVTDTEKATWNGKQDSLVADTDYLTPGTAATIYAPVLGADDNYVTDAEKTVIGNTSGTNTGDQDLSGLATKVASGSQALGTTQISDGACATLITVSAPGVVTTDVINIGYNSTPIGKTGYDPTAGPELSIRAFPTVDNINILVCNRTGAAVTPAAMTVNWRVDR